VNIGSRMESSGIPNRVNISQTTWEQVKGFFDCEFRSKIVAKNKGEMAMYLVKGIKKELAEWSGPVTPNVKFWEKYQALG